MGIVGVCWEAGVTALGGVHPHPVSRYGAGSSILSHQRERKVAHTKDPRAVTGQGAGRRARGCGCPTPGGFETHPYGDGWCGDGMPGSVTAGRLMVLARGVNIGRWPIDSGTGPLSVSLNGQPVRSLPVDIQRRARMRLQRVVAATALGDLRVPPSHRLESLRR